MSLSARHLMLSKSGRTLLEVPQLDLLPGQLHALLGPNGAGKSTLLSALSGMERSTALQVMLQGRPLSQWDTLDLARQRALMTQDHQVPFDFEVDDIVRMGRYPHSEHPHPQEHTLIDHCLALAGARALKGRRYEQLSGGEKARVQLARVLAQVHARPSDTSPRWLLLDEPTAALDLAHQHAVMRLLRQLTAQGMGVLVVLHDINLASAYADQVLVMNDGRIDASGRSMHVLQPPLVQRIWGVMCERLTRQNCLPSNDERGWLAFS
ncbi:MAG TPA: heme ABC transporter ATP-binding protein [Aquabacterium sp.]|uniref:heme ABC transporter ATP-binding protein n=1 Tax=Aquabacterium sp. TaxID=1872578 RepID=UPI002E328E4F|nr:heme ABC transporter ATP-binding protein [Aquabacterium sp.]HEX5372535.1 heme ABC transporter ATP-binding protein [Aquabacterium sp.]